MVRAFGSHPRGHRFEPHCLHQITALRPACRRCVGVVSCGGLCVPVHRWVWKVRARSESERQKKSGKSPLRLRWGLFLYRCRELSLPSSPGYRAKVPRSARPCPTLVSGPGSPPLSRLRQMKGGPRKPFFPIDGVRLSGLPIAEESGHPCATRRTPPGFHRFPCTSALYIAYI